MGDTLPKVIELIKGEIGIPKRHRIIYDCPQVSVKFLIQNYFSAYISVIGEDFGHIRTLN